MSKTIAQRNFNEAEKLLEVAQQSLRVLEQEMFSDINRFGQKRAYIENILEQLQKNELMDVASKKQKLE
jgi:hypothetical protein